MVAMIVRLLLILLLALPTAAAAEEKFERDTLEIVSRDGERHRFTVELAKTPAQQQQGLMFRREMALDAGMLFLYDRDGPIHMWMKNTLIPLDMLFIQADGRIAHIAERTVPFSEDTISSRRRVRAVLELNGGTADRLGIQVGDRIVHPAFR